MRWAAAKKTRSAGRIVDVQHFLALAVLVRVPDHHCGMDLFAVGIAEVSLPHCGAGSSLWK
jgi:hypothetical protein